MKNLKTCNFTQIRDISDGLCFRFGELNMIVFGSAKNSIII